LAGKQGGQAEGGVQDDTGPLAPQRPETSRQATRIATATATSPPSPNSTPVTGTGCVHGRHSVGAFTDRRGISTPKRGPVPPCTADAERSRVASHRRDDILVTVMRSQEPGQARRVDNHQPRCGPTMERPPCRWHCRLPNNYTTCSTTSAAAQGAIPGRPVGGATQAAPAQAVSVGPAALRLPRVGTQKADGVRTIVSVCEGA